MILFTYTDSIIHTISLFLTLMLKVYHVSFAQSINLLKTFSYIPLYD